MNVVDLEQASDTVSLKRMCQIMKKLRHQSLKIYNRMLFKHEPT